MLGPLDAAPKQKKAAPQRIARKPVGAAVAPQLLEAEDADAKVPITFPAFTSTKSRQIRQKMESQ